MVSATILGALAFVVIVVLVLEVLLKPQSKAPSRRRSEAVPLMQPRAAPDALVARFDTIRTS